MGLEALASDELLGRLNSQTSSNHSTLGAKSTNGITTVVSNKDGLGEAQQTSSVCSTDLTRRVTNDRGRLNAPGAEKINKTNLHSSADRLAASDLVDAAGAWAIEESLLQSPVRGIGSRQSLKDGIQSADGVAEVLARHQELLGHTSVLSTLTGEDESERKGVERLAQSVLVQSNDLAASLGEEDTSVAEMITTASKSVSETLKGGSILNRLNALSDLLDASLKSLGGGGGDGKDNKLLLVNQLGGRQERLRHLVGGEVALRVLENDVSVGTSITEGVDRSTTKGTGPVLDLGSDLDVALVEDQLGVELLNTGRRGDLALLKGHDNLENGSETGSTLTVTDIRLD
jgi:hypothetical protein